MTVICKYIQDCCDVKSLVQPGVDNSITKYIIIIVKSCERFWVVFFVLFFLIKAGTVLLGVLNLQRLDIVLFIITAQFLPNNDTMQRKLLQICQQCLRGS